MKGRDSRKQTIITAAAAIVAGATTGAIIGITAVTPHVYNGARTAANIAMQAFREKQAKGMPAAKAKKAELDKLKAEQKKLDKDKKALEKKKLNARKAQAKKIYEERVKYGYEASLPLVDKYAGLAMADADKYQLDETKSKKKAKKAKKSKKSAPVIVDNSKMDTIAIDPKRKYAEEQVVVDGQEPDYSSSASMFKGISF